MKVVVLMGGRSSERDVSLRSGIGIGRALVAQGHQVLAVDTGTGRRLPGEALQSLPGPGGLGELEPAGLQSAGESALAHLAPGLLDSPEVLATDMIFIALHGGVGEDGTLQALLDLAGLPYTGSGSLASGVAMDKAMAKRIFEWSGIPTPRWWLLDLAHVDDLEDAVRGRPLRTFPLVVKPNAEGSTIGLSIVREETDVLAATREAARFGARVLFEEFIEGREITAAVLGDEVLPLVEIIPHKGIYDYESKYTRGMSDYLVPAEMEEPVRLRVEECALRAFRDVGCAGFARVDFRLAPDGTPYCLEVNTIPGMTELSLVPMAARARGIEYGELVERVCRLALEARRRKSRAAD
jgi:D-alanine-D-alanine ligase